MPRTTPPTTESATHRELTSVARIRERYELPGPHVTVVLGVPTPRTVGNDFVVRWNATQADMRRHGASAEAIGHMDDLVQSLQRHGHSLLITATDAGAALCWLGFEIEPAISVGALPALLPALHQASVAPSQIIGVVIDRIGADIYAVGAFDCASVGSVEGEDEQVHKAASGGWSQARHQRHSEVIWERNASLVAASVSAEAKRLGASSAVLTGDERAVRLVEARLGTQIATVAIKQAGGRHEPGTADRVHSAADQLQADSLAAATALALGDLREEIGQRDQAIAGSINVLAAINDNRVKTLFVDLAVDPTHDVDAVVRAALAHGANVVTAHDVDLDDGVAAMLRVPYSE